MLSLFGEFRVDYLFWYVRDATKRGFHLGKVFRLVRTTAIIVGTAHLNI